MDHASAMLLTASWDGKVREEINSFGTKKDVRQGRLYVI